ncbi:hypothetical protein [Mesorhizobium sp. NZP2077]|uniref:hypothetical protein n=1 Tax=Mesorhizobium sp. NZP2077 TaxID=2483404 RepID=UPI00155258B2|nr:hypothetical protein [Mesorhizobium sp. NZP2077]QKD15724.1 hypothetical protein HGP13_11800 [Mesorhizobium sp. NZP2077]
MELFRPDIVTSVGNHADLAIFEGRYASLQNDRVPANLFYPPHGSREGTATVLDVRNLMVHRRDDPEWKAMVEHGVRVATWDNADPLADVFLMQFGQFPAQEAIGIDYRRSLDQATQAVNLPIANGDPIPSEITQYPGISHLSRYDLTPHYSARAGWDYPGFYLGSAANIDDLVMFWNLRACGIQLAWHDLQHPARFDLVKVDYEARLRASLAGRDDFHNKPAIWCLDANRENAVAALGDGPWTICGVSEATWNGHNVSPAKMHFGIESALAVVGGPSQLPNLSFALKDKPFASDPWFYQQRLMASISVMGVPGDGSNYTFTPPCVPELNEFAGRKMILDYDGLRLEPEHVGIIIDAADVDLRIGAISIPTLIERIFALAGFQAKLSGSGLITRQLITSMGGLDGVRAFKISGVRRLIKSFGPTHSFSKNDATNKIGSKDPDTGSTFADHRRLYIEQRGAGTDLTPPMVFTHLVEKGLFRIGSDLRCPTCQLSSWTPLDSLKQKATCPLCGTAFDATRQLVESQFAYRRTGVLGVERNAAGAIPVAMVLQQLYVNLRSTFHSDGYGASYDLKPIDPGGGLPVCETDLVALVHEPRSSMPAVIIGECKDAGGAIDPIDIEHLRQVADAFPKERFVVYILLAKLSAFTPDEIELAKSLNTQFVRRVILLTHQELEPYRFYERRKDAVGKDIYASSAYDLAETTHRLYFLPQPTSAGPVADS